MQAKKKKEIEREEQRSPEQKELAPSTGPELEEEKKKKIFSTAGGENCLTFIILHPAKVHPCAFLAGKRAR